MGEVPEEDGGVNFGSFALPSSNEAESHSGGVEEVGVALGGQ